MSQLTAVYNEAYKYLENYLDNLKLPETGQEILELEFAPYRERKPFNDIKLIYKRLLESLKNRNMMASVLPDLEEFREMLFDFDHQKIHESYDEEKLVAKFAEKFGSEKVLRPRSLYRQFAKGVISSAKFMSRFKTAKEFNDFAKSFSFNEYTVAALPMLLDKEIVGFGFALSCDFLKESGYGDYGKPDVQLLDIFEGVGIISDRSEFETFKTIVQMAREVGKKPVIVDKLFWMIGSGKFEEYNRNNERKIPVHRLKNDFVRQYKEGIL